MSAKKKEVVVIKVKRGIAFSEVVKTVSFPEEGANFHHKVTIPSGRVSEFFRRAKAFHSTKDN